MLQASFGWISSTGYTPPGAPAATLFPTIVGELGAQMYLPPVSVQLSTHPDRTLHDTPCEDCSLATQH